MTTRTFHPDLPLCQEPSNCSWLHPSERLNNTARRLSVFVKSKDFFPKHRYGKTAATGWTMCVPVRTLSFIRQSCIQCSTVRMLDFMVRPLNPNIWKLRASVQPSGCHTSSSRCSKTWYGNWVQLKCNRLDATATPSWRILIQERILCEFEKQVAQFFIRIPPR